MTDRACPFCRAVTACLIHDSAKSRAYECQHCLAVEWITKGQGKAPQPWWYHGWQALDEGDQPGERINGDGIRATAPLRFLEWVTLATEGNLDASNGVAA